MPKRKSDKDCDRLQKKIRKLEKKLARKRRRQDSSSDSLSSRSFRDESSEIQDIENRSITAISDDHDNLNSQHFEPIIECDQDLQIEKPASVASVVIIPPNLAGPSTSSDHVEPVALTDQVETQTTNLDDDDLLDILGIDPTTDKKYGKDIHKDLSVRLQHWATVGLEKDLRKDLKERYLTPDNCKLIDPPMLNAEMKAAISDVNIKRDKAIEGKQKMLTLSIACLGEAITRIMSSKDKDTVLLKLLMDAARITCDCQHTDSITRRKFVTGGLKYDMKEQMLNTKVDKYLFGEDLAETLKSAKAICKSGSELKPPAPKPSFRKPTPSSSNSAPKRLNWQNPGPVRRPTGPPRMRQPAPTSMHNRPFNFSKQLQYPQQRPNARR